MSLNSIIAFSFGPAGNAILGALTVPLMAWAFSVEDVGRINVLNVVISFSLLLSVFGLDQAYVREYHGCTDKNGLLKVCFFPGFILLLLITVVCIPFADYILIGFFGVNYPFMYFAIAFCMIANYVLRFLSLILRMQDRGLVYSLSMIIPKLSQLLLILLIIFMGFNRDFEVLILVTASSLYSTLLFCLWVTRFEWWEALLAVAPRSLVQSVLSYGVPLVFSGLAFWGLTATSTMILKSHSSLEQLGIYSVTNSLSSIAVIFQSIFSTIWAPLVYKWVNDNSSMSILNDITHQVLAIAFALFVFVGSFSWIVEYVLPAEYNNIKYLLACAVAPSLLYTLSEVTCVGINIARRTTINVWITLCALVTNLFFSIWLIPLSGAIGAVIANSIAYFVFFVGRTEASVKIWRSFPRVDLYVYTVIPISLGIMTAALGPSLPIHYSLIWAVFFPFLILIFGRQFKQIIMYVKKIYYDARGV